MNILLTGANGFIGHHLATKLRTDGHHVKAVSRSSGCDFTHMTNPESWLPYLKAIDVVINCVGIIAETQQQTFDSVHHHAPAAMFLACVNASVKRVIQISALGADDKAFTPYQLTKKSADDVLRNLPLQWFVLRPSLVYGAGGKSMALFKRMSQLPLIPLVDAGKQLIQPVHINDLIDTIIQCLHSSSSQKTLDVVGASPISLANWLQMMRQARNQTNALILNIPITLSIAFAHAGKFLIPLLHPDNLRMLQQGNTADVKPLADFLGRMPLDAQTGWRNI